VASLVLGCGILMWGNVYRLFARGALAFGFTPFLVPLAVDV
jgi:hypothetical protein